MGEDLPESCLGTGRPGNALNIRMPNAGFDNADQAFAHYRAGALGVVERHERPALARKRHFEQRRPAPYATQAAGQSASASDNCWPMAPADESRLESTLQSLDHMGKRIAAETARPSGLAGRRYATNGRRFAPMGKRCAPDGSRCAARNPLRGPATAPLPHHRRQHHLHAAATRNQTACNCFLPTIDRVDFGPTRCASNHSRTSCGSYRDARPTFRSLGKVGSVAARR